VAAGVVLLLWGFCDLVLGPGIFGLGILASYGRANGMAFAFVLLGTIVVVFSVISFVCAVGVFRATDGALDVAHYSTFVGETVSWCATIILVLLAMGQRGFVGAAMTLLVVGAVFSTLASITRWFIGRAARYYALNPTI
jgi:hypothetical protein